VDSHALHGSESLCKLLRYLAQQALTHPGEPIKEYRIATEVFGRSPDFDPHTDSQVRVQAGRLRSKLAEYYVAEGAADPIIIELPKGTYTLSFRSAVPNGEVAVRRQLPYPAPAPAPVPPPAERPPLAKVSSATVALAGALVIAVAGLVFLLATRNDHLRAAAASKLDNPAPQATQIFWHSFTSGPEEPWVIFSNGAFVGRPETGLRYFDPAKDSREAILDHYTGVGEVLAVENLDHVLGLMHQPIRVKRGSLFSLDDAENNNLIFVGSPAENLTLRDLPSTREFVFQRPSTGPRTGDLGIVNIHPQANESKIYFGSASGTPLTEDYAVIALVPGMNPARSVLILAGTTTIGTQAAAEFVSREDCLARLLLALGVSDASGMKPFEALLRVKVARGVPVGTQLVSVRKLAQ
jgi:hypothetical protein